MGKDFSRNRSFETKTQGINNFLSPHLMHIQYKNREQTVVEISRTASIYESN